MNIQLSPAAAQHLRHDLDGRVLRIAFTDGIRVALDSMAASRLDGAVIEYDADEDGYSLEHPDAVSAVWCG